MPAKTATTRKWLGRSSFNTPDGPYLLYPWPWTSSNLYIPCWMSRHLLIVSRSWKSSTDGQKCLWWPVNYVVRLSAVYRVIPRVVTCSNRKHLRQLLKTIQQAKLCFDISWRPSSHEYTSRSWIFGYVLFLWFGYPFFACRWTNVLGSMSGVKNLILADFRVSVCISAEGFRSTTISQMGSSDLLFTSDILLKFCSKMPVLKSYNLHSVSNFVTIFELT